MGLAGQRRAGLGQRGGAGSEESEWFFGRGGADRLVGWAVQGWDN